MATTTRVKFDCLAEDRNGLSEARIRATCPAIFAQAKGEETSKHFTFIQTSRLLAALAEEGFVPTLVAQKRPRDIVRVGSAKHLVRFCHRDDLHTRNPERQELSLLNAHCSHGGSAYQLFISIYRFVCNNGLVRFGGTNTLLHVPHRGNIVEKVVEGTLELSYRAEETLEDVRALKNARLSEAQQWHLAQQIWRERFGLDEQGRTKEGKFPLYRPEDLTVLHFPDDAQDNAWAFLNVLQYNTLHGGAVRKDTNDHNRRLRGIHNIDDSLRLNRRLWEIVTQEVGLN